MPKRKVSQLRIEARSLFRRIFHVLLDRLEIRRSEEHSFLLPFYRGQPFSLIWRASCRILCSCEIRIFNFPGAARRGES